jgi:DNA-binding CsgD family transcriptional regulator
MYGFNTADRLHAASSLESSGFSGTPWPKPVAEVARSDLFSQLADQLSHGIVAVDAHLQLLYANATARATLTCANLLRQSRDQLEGCSPKNHKALEQLVRYAFIQGHAFAKLDGTSPIGANADAMCIAASAHETDTLPAQFTRVRNRAPGHSIKQMKVVLLVMQRPADAHGYVAEQFAQVHQLTAAESAVLTQLMHTQHAPTVARRMRLATSTVRTHIRKIFDKTGVSSMSQLIGRLATMPPLTGASARLSGTRINGGEQ